jgi:formimidoylglutamate deiminase
MASEGRSRIEEAGERTPPRCGIEHALEGALALADAAAEAGIGLTLLPALYERAGFGQPALRPEQQRFAGSVESVCALRDALRAGGRPGLDVGLAIHSLRAVSADSILRLLDRLDDAPLHLHIAEQAGEVADCLAATGRRPIEWLAASVPLDARWQLVHATHATPAEIDAVARRGAGVVLCPGTEADLGDGLPDLPRWLDAGVPLAIGSDSQVTRDWPAELRLLEHGQRLALRRRNIAASADEPSTAARLFGRVLDGGAAAAGHARWGLVVGARADLLVLDLDEPALLGVEPARRLDALVFASAARPFRDVLVGGRWSLRGHRHVAGAGIAARFEAAVREVATGGE